MRTKPLTFKSPWPRVALAHFLLLAVILGPSHSGAAKSVRVYETDLTIPTYLSGPPDPNPMFYFGRESQGAEGRIYPYPLYDNLTHQRVDKTYHLVYLENEYVRIGILPEIGGRLFEAVDKGNHYNFVYRQHVIKPALIGLIGAWISGGIEWNIPHHHRASTFLPVQWQIEEHPDGRKTVWVGELEVRHRMRWAVGYTLRPGSSVLTCSVRILNRTPEAHTMLCFANVAVNANENYQIIFPAAHPVGHLPPQERFRLVADCALALSAARIFRPAWTSVGTGTTPTPTPCSRGITRRISSPATTMASRPGP